MCGEENPSPSLSFTAAAPLFLKSPPSCQSLSRGVGSSASSIRDVVVVVVDDDDGEGEDGHLTITVYLKLQYIVILLFSVLFGVY